VREVAFCALTEARGTDGVLRALSGALDVPLTQQDPVAQLGHVFERRSGLVLILDNCEQVAGEVAELLTQWSASLEGVRMVATSRLALGVRAERQVALEPLGDAALACALYTARAQQVRSGWVCPEGQEGALLELMEELDRLPLAIELAAARVKVLGPKKMLGRIAQRFKVLRTRGKGVGDRQATLRGAIAWSWDLLDAAQKSAMAQMSVFEGSFTLEAAEEVVDLSDFEDEPFVLDVFEELVGASLLRNDAHEERFRMLVSVRAFAAEQLADSGAEDIVRGRHACWFARWTLDDVERERGIGFLQLSSEVDDLEAASSWGLSPGRSAEERDWAMVCTACHAATLESRGPFHLVDALAQRVRSNPSVASESKARALGRLGFLARLGGRHVLSRRLCEQAMEMARELGDSRSEGRWLRGLGVLELEEGDAVEARVLFEQALAISRQLGDLRFEGVCMGNLGNIEREQDNLREARRLYEQALIIFRQLGDLRFEGVCLGNLGSLEYEQDNAGEARRLYEQALAINRQLGDLRFESIWLGNLGGLELGQDNLREARRLYEQALEISTRVGDTLHQAQLRAGLGQCDVSDGLDDAARTHLDACFALLPALKLASESSQAGPVLELAEALGVEVPEGTFAE